MSGDILLGVVIGAQGLSGEVKVKTFTSAIENLRGYGPLHDKDGREFIVASARHAKADIAVVRFKGVDDRNAAEALKGAELRVARDALPHIVVTSFRRRNKCDPPATAGKLLRIAALSAANAPDDEDHGSRRLLRHTSPAHKYVSDGNLVLQIFQITWRAGRQDADWPSHRGQLGQ